MFSRFKRPNARNASTQTNGQVNASTQTNASLLKRAIQAKKVLTVNKLSPTNSVLPKLTAAAVLVGTNSRVNKGINVTKKMLAIPNNRNANLKNLGESIKRSLKLNNPLMASNEVKNKAVRVASNYVAMKLGYTNRTNTDNIHLLISKIMRLKTNMNAATNNVGRQRLGNELGTTLGKLILSYSKLKRGPSNARTQNITKGFLNGIMTEILGPQMAGTVMKIVNKTTAVYSWYKTPTQRPNNWVPPRITEVN